MSVKHLRDHILINDHLMIEQDVIYCGAGPYIRITDFNEPIEGGIDDFMSIDITTKQEAEEVMKVCKQFLDNYSSWDWVKKDKSDDHS